MTKSPLGRRLEFALLLCLTLLAAACARHPSASADAGVLKVASQRGSTRAVMEASGVLKDAPYKVEWSEFAAASPLLEALGAGAVDVGGRGGRALRLRLCGRGADQGGAGL
ncbi:MAG: hypothetical protein WDM92_05725 [Caulobacteraceae bacterium]